MNDNIQRLVDQNNFLSFWIWEYGIRHTCKNRRLFSSFKKCEPIDGDKEFCGLIGYEFDSPIGLTILNKKRRCFCYKSSTDMINALLKNNFKLINECKHWTPQGIIPAGIIFHYSPDSHIGNSIREKYNLTEEQYKNVLMDTIKYLEKEYNSELALIPNEISVDDICSHIKYMRSIPPDFDEEGNFLEQDDEEGSDELQESVEELRAINCYLFRISNASRVQLSSCTSRIVGLWLWDKVHELGNKRGAINQAIRSLSEQFDLKRLGLEHVEDSDFRFYLSRTRDCISNASVLPFSKKRTE